MNIVHDHQTRKSRIHAAHCRCSACHPRMVGADRSCWSTRFIAALFLLITIAGIIIQFAVF